MDKDQTLQDIIIRVQKLEVITELGESDSLEQKLKKVFATRSEFEALNTEIDGQNNKIKNFMRKFDDLKVKQFNDEENTILMVDSLKVRIKECAKNERVNKIEAGLDDRVHILKFQALEQKMRLYCCQSQHDSFVEKTELLFHGLQKQFKPLVTTLVLEANINDVKARINKRFEAFSTTRECQANKKQCENLILNLRSKIADDGDKVFKLAQEVEDHAYLIERKAQKEDIQKLSTQLSLIPTKEEIKQVRFDLFDKITLFSDQNDSMRSEFKKQTKMI